MWQSRFIKTNGYKEKSMTYYEKHKEEVKQKSKEYYQKNRENLLQKAKVKYFNTRKKTPKCKKCGILLPKELPGQMGYCDKCLYSKGHGKEAGRLASARWARKKHLTKIKEN